MSARNQTETSLSELSAYFVSFYVNQVGYPACGSEVLETLAGSFELAWLRNSATQVVTISTFSDLIHTSP